MSGPTEALGAAGSPRAPDEIAAGVTVEDVGDLDDAVLDPAGQGGNLPDGAPPTPVQVEVDDQVDGAGHRRDHEVAGDVLP